MVCYQVFFTFFWDKNTSSPAAKTRWRDVRFYNIYLLSYLGLVPIKLSVASQRKDKWRIQVIMPVVIKIRIKDVLQSLRAYFKLALRWFGDYV